MGGDPGSTRADHTQPPDRMKSAGGNRRMAVNETRQSAEHMRCGSPPTPLVTSAAQLPSRRARRLVSDVCRAGGRSRSSGPHRRLPRRAHPRLPLTGGRGRLRPRGWSRYLTALAARGSRSPSHSRPGSRRSTRRVLLRRCRRGWAAGVDRLSNVGGALETSGDRRRTTAGGPRTPARWSSRPQAPRARCVGGVGSGRGGA
jgi:hypothetical protein